MLRAFSTRAIALQRHASRAPRKSIATEKTTPAAPLSLLSLYPITNLVSASLQSDIKDTVARVRATLLSLGSSTASKHIAMNSPHPGATLYNQDIVMRATQNLKNARLFSIDFKDMTSCLSRDINSLKQQPLITTQAFSPALFATTEDFHAPSNIDAEHEDADVEFDDAPLYVVQRKQLLDSPPVFSSFPNMPSTELSVADIAKLNPTHYSDVLSQAQLASLSDQYQSAIVSLEKEHQNSNSQISGTKRSQSLHTVVFVKDTNDILLSPSGKDLIQTLLAATASLRKRNIRTTLVFNSTPPLADQSITKPTSFYRDIFNGHFEFGEKPLPLEIVGGVYRVDFWKRDFGLFTGGLSRMRGIVGIDVHPVVNADGVDVRLRERIDEEDELNETRDIKSSVEEDVQGEWLNAMDVDLKSRFRDMNWMNIRSLMNDRKWKGCKLINDAGNMEACDTSYKNQPLFAALDDKILGMHQIEDVVDLAYGCSLDMRSDRPRAAKGASISLADFGEALRLMYPGDPRTAVTHTEIDLDSRKQAKERTLIEETVIQAQQLKKDESKEQTLEAIKSMLLKKLTPYEKKLMATVVDPDVIKVKFDDLILPDTTKKAVMSVVTLPLLYPSQFSTGILANHSINGVLLFGPPGTGKTMLAKALAKSSGAKFMSVALSDIFDKYVGEGEKNVKAIFTLARKLSPCIVFLDEVDGVFGQRQSDSTGSRREVINEFMSEWDGLTSNNDGVIVLGATNRPFDLDDAILRRMPRRVLIDLPNLSERKRILVSHLRGEILDGVDLAQIAKRTSNYSGSDLKNVCVSAATSRVNAMVDEMLKTNAENKGEDKESSEEEPPSVDTVKRVLVQSDFDLALKEIPASVSDGMQTLVELRKWDEGFGEGSGQKAKKGWGFDQPINTPPL